MPGGHRAVIFDRFAGVKKEVVGEGTHFLVPWLQRPIIYDVRTRPRNINTTTGSKGVSVFLLKIILDGDVLEIERTAQTCK